MTPGWPQNLRPYQVFGKTHFGIKLDEITGARGLGRTFENGSTFYDTWLTRVGLRGSNKKPEKRKEKSQCMNKIKFQKQIQYSKDQRSQGFV